MPVARHPAHASRGVRRQDRARTAVLRAWARAVRASNGGRREVGRAGPAVHSGRDRGPVSVPAVRRGTPGAVESARVAPAVSFAVAPRAVPGPVGRGSRVGSEPSAQNAPMPRANRTAADLARAVAVLRVVRTVVAPARAVAALRQVRTGAIEGAARIGRRARAAVAAMAHAATRVAEGPVARASGVVPTGGDHRDSPVRRAGMERFPPAESIARLRGSSRLRIGRASDPAWSLWARKWRSGSPAYGAMPSCFCSGTDTSPT